MTLIVYIFILKCLELCIEKTKLLRLKKSTIYLKEIFLYQPMSLICSKTIKKQLYYFTIKLLNKLNNKNSSYKFDFLLIFYFDLFTIATIQNITHITTTD